MAWFGNVKNTAAGILLVACGALAWSALHLAAGESVELDSSLVVEHVDDESLRLTFAGDLMAHSINFRMREFADMYSSVAHILQSDDLSFVNLEFPVDASRPYASYPRFNVHPEYVETAIDAGFDVFSAANNHTADWYRSGIQATLDFLSDATERRGIVHSGIRAEAGGGFEIATIEHEGWHVGFLAVTQFSNEWREYAGLDRVHLLTYRRAARADAFIEWLGERTSRYDLFVLSYHGGVEYALEPEPSKLAFFRKAVAAGVDIVWGHHPHVLQPWERIVRPDGSDALILPSTGNFVSGQPSRLDHTEWENDRAATGDTALYEIHADRVGDRLELSLSVIPLLHRRHSGGVAVVPMPSARDDWAVYEGQRRRLSAAQRRTSGPEWFVD